MKRFVGTSLSLAALLFLACGGKAEEKPTGAAPGADPVVDTTSGPREEPAVAAPMRETNDAGCVSDAGTREVDPADEHPRPVLDSCRVVGACTDLSDECPAGSECITGVFEGTSYRGVCITLDSHGLLYSAVTCPSGFNVASKGSIPPSYACKRAKAFVDAGL